MIFRISVAVAGIPSWFSVALALLLAGPGLPAVDAAAEEQEEVGIWRCVQARRGTCPPDGLGRGPEDFWTDKRIARRKVSVSCELHDSSWTERCTGIFEVFGIRVSDGAYGARLTCPQGYVRRIGQCVEVNPPRADKKCSSPAGSPVNAATGQNNHTVTDWSGPPSAARSSSTTTARSRLELRRYYSSHFKGLATPNQSRLGNGWRTSFDAVAAWSGALASARHIHVMLPDFTEITYALENGVWRPKDSYEWTRPRTGVTATLRVSAGTVTLRQADGTRYLFNDKGQLKQIVAPDGYTQTLTYTENLNTLVTDSRGNWISFTYNVNGRAASGLLAYVRTSDGKLMHYQYEDRSQAGRKVKDQMTTGTNHWALKSVNNLMRGGGGAPTFRGRYTSISTMPTGPI
jgi:hypothetical protein